MALLAKVEDHEKRSEQYGWKGKIGTRIMEDFDC
jgi:hypothetical protein